MKNKLRSGLASDEENNYKTRTGIPSGPEDFLTSRFASTLVTFLVRIRASGIVHEARGVKRSGWLDSESVEFLEKVSDEILALSIECGLAIFIQMRYWWCCRIFQLFYERQEVFAELAIIKRTLGRKFCSCRNCWCFSMALHLFLACLRSSLLSVVGFDFHSMNTSFLGLTAWVHVVLNQERTFGSVDLEKITRFFEV